VGLLSPMLKGARGGPLVALAVLPCVGRNCSYPRSIQLPPLPTIHSIIPLADCLGGITQVRGGTASQGHGALILHAPLYISFVILHAKQTGMNMTLAPVARRSMRASRTSSTRPGCGRAWSPGTAWCPWTARGAACPTMTSLFFVYEGIDSPIHR
jgi:hypothetical protein